jgi:hypothetical protein
MSKSFRVEDLSDVYAIGFLCYVLNEDPGIIANRLSSGGQNLDAQKEAVLHQLVVMENLLREFPNRQRNLERGARLADYHEEIGGTVPSYFRQVCGGISSLPATSDHVEQLLLHFAEVSYPLRLQNDKDGEISSARIPWRDPAREKLSVAVMADDVLSMLYPDNLEHSGPSGNVLRSTGHGGSIQLWMFPESITTAAWHLAHFESAEPSFGSYVSAVLHIVQTLKKALLGRVAELPMRIGLAGVLLPEGVDSIDLGWARIRGVDRRDEYFARRTSIEGQVQLTTGEGASISIDYVGNLVLEFDIPYKVLLNHADLTGAWPNEVNSATVVSEIVECIRLGMLLAGIGENSAAVPTWQSIVDPLSCTESIRWNDPSRGANLLPIQLTNHQPESWRAWIIRIHDHRTPQTNVSVRRILRAVSELKEPEDTLIDAVVVWENLFGAGQETTLRITMSVAWMLGLDADNRRKLWDDLKKIYQQRSDIVHGNAKLKADRTYPYAMQAVGISIELLRGMFKDHPELLKLKTGAERSALILLDAIPDVRDGERNAPL